MQLRQWVHRALVVLLTLISSALVLACESEVGPLPVHTATTIPERPPPFPEPTHAPEPTNTPLLRPESTYTSLPAPGPTDTPLAVSKPVYTPAPARTPMPTATPKVTPAPTSTPWIEYFVEGGQSEWPEPNLMGVLHEAVFEPVTLIGADGEFSESCLAVGADHLRGNLAPRSFIDHGGAEIALPRIVWKPIYNDDDLEWLERPGIIEIQLEPLRELANYDIDFIRKKDTSSGDHTKSYWTENTGFIDDYSSVIEWFTNSNDALPLCPTLGETDSSGTLIKIVTGYQPWREGDELTVRIRKTLLTGLKVLDLGYLIPSHFFDGKLIAIEGLKQFGESEIFSIDLNIGEWTQLTDDGRPKDHPAMSATYLAWVDVQNRHTDEILVRDLHAGEISRVTEGDASRSQLKISDSRLIWLEDLDHGERGNQLYAYDLESEELIPVAIGGYTKRISPSIDGDIVVWVDERAGREPLNIYMYDFATGEEKQIGTQQWFNAPPTIEDDLITWEAAEGVVQLDIGTGHRRILFDRDKYNDWPVWSEHFGSDTYVSWSVVAPNLTTPIPARENRQEIGVFVYDSEKGEVRQISDDRVSHSKLYGNIIVIEKLGPTSGRGTYAVFLE